MKKLLITFLLLICANSVFAAEEWLKGRPQSGDTKNAWPAASQANNDSLDRLLANYQQGMYLTYNSSSTLTVVAGSVMCSTSDGSVRHMRQNTTSTNVTFSNLDTGSSTASTTYYVYADCDADATTATFIVSASNTSPSGVTSYYQIGSFVTDSNISITLINNNTALGTQAGALSSKTNNVVYQALTDVEAGCNGNPSSGQSSVVLDIGSTSSPVTTVGTCGSNPVNIDCSFSWIVPKGFYYEFVGSISSLNCYAQPTSK